MKLKHFLLVKYLSFLRDAICNFNRSLRMLKDKSTIQTDLNIDSSFCCERKRRLTSQFECKENFGTHYCLGTKSIFLYSETFSRCLSLERNYTEVFYIIAKQKQKDFVEKGEQIFSC